MITSVIILVVSASLFVYWFRYTCMLILSTRTARNYARSVAEVNGLEFVETRSRLASGECERLEQLHRSLDRDYQVVTSLLRHAADGVGTQSLEQALLRLDYRLMDLCFRLMGGRSGSLGRRFLLEMSSVVSQLANAMGERSAVNCQSRF